MRLYHLSHRSASENRHSKIKNHWRRDIRIVYNSSTRMKSYCSSVGFIFFAAVFILIAANSSKPGAIIGQLPRPAADTPALSIPTAVLNFGDNAWMLASCALVLMMTAPGLILLYGGLVRAKNVLATMMHSLILMALVSMVWMIFGYSMVNAPTVNRVKAKREL
jgi:hypothetical protein